MFDDFVRTLVKLAVASLALGTALAYFGVTPEKLLREVGLTQEQAMELVRQAVAWAMPNLTLGALVIVPVWFVVYLFRPPRPRARLD
jgi:alkylhydroperoxidase family enzyme